MRPMLHGKTRSESIRSIRKRLGDNELSATALCSGALENAGLQNLSLNAFSELLDRSALADAAAIDVELARGIEAGPLAGVPIAIKDNIDTVPANCGAGLAIYKDHKPNTDAEIVRRLKKAGAVIIGVTRTDSGAFGVITPEVQNPLFQDRIVGGSSGGSAAAVAAKICTAAIGTDTGGSIRIPAACCGLFGFKPTIGRVPMSGIRPMTDSYDHVGPIASSVDDVIAIMEVIDVDFAKSGKTSLGDNPIVGIPRNCFLDASNEVQSVVEHFVETAKTCGLTFKEVEIPQPSEVVPIHLKLSLSEAATFYGHVSDELLATFPEAARMGIEFGRTVTANQVKIAKTKIAKVVEKIQETFDEVDFLVMPTLPTLPPTRGLRQVEVGGEMMDILMALIRYTATFDQTGHPVLTFPHSTNQSEIPGSLQLIGPKNSDHWLLAFAKKYAL